MLLELISTVLRAEGMSPIDMDPSLVSVKYHTACAEDLVGSGVGVRVLGSIDGNSACCLVILIGLALMVPDDVADEIISLLSRLIVGSMGVGVLRITAVDLSDVMNGMRPLLNLTVAIDKCSV